jgi:hypothetical protein
VRGERGVVDRMRPMANGRRGGRDGERERRDEG